MPVLQAIGASLRVMCRAKKSRKTEMDWILQFPVGKSAGCLGFQSKSLLLYYLFHGWCCPHVPIGKKWFFPLSFHLGSMGFR